MSKEFKKGDFSPLSTRFSAFIIDFIIILFITSIVFYFVDKENIEQMLKYNKQVSEIMNGNIKEQVDSVIFILLEESFKSIVLKFSIYVSIGFILYFNSLNLLFNHSAGQKILGISNSKVEKGNFKFLIKTILHYISMVLIVPLFFIKKRNGIFSIWYDFIFPCPVLEKDIKPL